MENKETFVMYKSYIDAVSKIKNNDDKLEFLLGICNYSLTGIEPQFNSDIADIVFTAIKPSIDGASKRYASSVENGKKGGAPKGNANAKKKQPKNNPTNNLEQPTETTQNNLYVYEDVYEDDYVYDDEDVSVDVIVPKEIILTRTREGVAEPFQNWKDVDVYLQDNNIDLMHDFHGKAFWENLSFQKGTLEYQLTTIKNMTKRLETI